MKIMMMMEIQVMTLKSIVNLMKGNSVKLTKRGRINTGQVNLMIKCSVRLMKKKNTTGN